MKKKKGKPNPYRRQSAGALILAMAILGLLVNRLLLTPAAPSGKIITALQINGFNKLHEINVTTGDVQRLKLNDEIENMDHAYAISIAPNQEWAIFIGSDTTGIHIFAARGDDVRQLTFNERDSNPRQSPDGQTVVFVRSRNYFSALFSVDIASGEEHQLTDYTNDLEPNWSPDGQRIVFTTSRDGFQELYSMSPDGTNQRRLTYNENFNDLYASFSPDGTKIAYMQNYSVSDGTSEIWLMNADGSNQHPITQNNIDDRDPHWSPDGTKIVFVQTEPDHNGTEVFVYDVRADNLIQLTQNPGHDYSPVWSPDSQWIAFISMRDFANGGLYIIRPDGKDLRAVVAEEEYRFGYGMVWVR